MTEDPWSRLGHDRESPMVCPDLCSRSGLGRDVLGIPGRYREQLGRDLQVTGNPWS